jgi:hypothetical protein
LDLFVVKPLHKKNAKSGGATEEQGLQIWVCALDSSENTEWTAAAAAKWAGGTFDLVDKDNDGVVMSSELVYQAMGWDERQAFQLLGAEESFQKFVDPDDLGTILRAAFVEQMSRQSELCAALASTAGKERHVLFCCTFQQFEDALTSIDMDGETADILLEHEGMRGEEGPTLLTRLARTLMPRRAVELCGGGVGGGVGGGLGPSTSEEITAYIARLHDAEEQTKVFQVHTIFDVLALHRLLILLHCCVVKMKVEEGRLELLEANEKHTQALAKHDVRARTAAEVGSSITRLLYH